MFEEEDEATMETSRRRSKKHFDLLLPFLLPLFHRVDVDGEANGRLHSSSGRGTVLSAPERQVRRPAGPARHLRQLGLEQHHPERDPRGRNQSKTVNFFCDDSRYKLMLFTGLLFDQPSALERIRLFKENI